jgi:hypothetical protein
MSLRKITEEALAAKRVEQMRSVDAYFAQISDRVLEQAKLGHWSYMHRIPTMEDPVPYEHLEKLLQERFPDAIVTLVKRQEINVTWGP